MEYLKEHVDVEGAKGKGGGGGGGGYSEDPNTLRSLSLVRVLEAVSEGPIVGLATGDGKSIFFDDTPIQNDDGTFNFNAVNYDTRTGLPSQPYMSGFPSVESVVSVGTTIHYGTPVVEGVSSSLVDAVRVTIQLPNGLSNQSTSSGSLHGSSVTLAIDRQVQGSGIWETVVDTTITGKTMTSYEVDYRIEKPANCSGLWNFRVRRTQADATAANIHDTIALARFTEIQDVKLEYDYTAYVGIAVDAQSTGGRIPARSYLLKGLIISVPTNYDPVTRVYTGQWDGTFKQAWSDNPAWVLYDLLISVRYGMGEYVAPSMIDKFSFYDAAVYNDQLVPDGKGGQEPRFTFNYVINQQQDGLKILQAVAGMMRSTVMYSGGLIWINQDRPSDPVKLVTKANVIDGKFSYTSTPLQQRHTVARVTYNDANDRYMPAVTTIESSAGIARYGYNPSDVAAYGAVTEGQAIRHGKWILDTELTTTEIVTYKSSFNQFDLQVGDVIKLYDEDYTQTSGSGRLVSANAANSTFKLDRQVTLGNLATIDVLDNDGTTICTYNLNEHSGSFDTVTATQPFTAFNAGNDYVINSTVTARLFRVMEIKFEGENVVTVKAGFYDPAKYARVESGITVTPPVYSSLTANKCGVVTNVTATPEGYVDPVLGAQVALRIDWTPPTTDGVVGYEVKYNKDSGQFSPMIVTSQPSYTIHPADQGVYEVQIIAVNVRGVRSLPVVSTFAHGYSGNCVLNPPTSVVLATGHGTGTNWSGTDLYVQWTPDSSNSTVSGSTVGGYRVKITNADTLQVIRNDDVDLNTTSYEYTLTNNMRDNVTPVRHLRVDVYTLDAYSRPSVTAATQTFTNPAPTAPSNVVVVGTVAGAKITMDRPTDTDYVGVLVWGSTTSGFSPSTSNLLFEGDASVISLTGLSPSSQYYFKVAAYDVFSKAYDGTGLNLSPQYTATTLQAGGGVASVGSLPGTASEGDVVCLTTDGKLYRYHSGAWTAAVPAVDVTGQIAGSQLASGAVTTSKIAAGAVTANEIAANTISADKLVANSITSAQLATSTLLTTSAQVGTGVINTAAIQDAAITNAKIGDVTADKITTGTLAAATQINVGSSVLIDGGNSLISTTGATTKTVMSAGNVVSYTNVGGTWYPYQMLSHVETGQASNNTAVTIPGYYITQPKVLVTPANLALYNPTYSAQGQSIVCAPGSVSETSTGSRIWQFTPTATLNLAANTGTNTINAGSGDTSVNSWTSLTYTTPANCTTITPSVNLKSVRGNGLSQYYYRSMRWRVEYYNGSAWVTTDPLRAVNMGAQTTTAITDSKTFTFPSAAAWQWRIYVEEYDTDGTVFGTAQYNYTTNVVTMDAGTSTYTNWTNAQQYMTTDLGPITGNISFPTYSVPSGWELYQKTYNWEQGHWWSFFSSSDWFHGCVVTVAGNSTLPTANLTGTYDTSTCLVGYAKTKTITGSSPVTTDLNYVVSKASQNTTNYLGVLVRNATVTMYLRQAVANSTTPVNNTLINSYQYSLTSAQVLATGTLNWVAIGN